MANLYTGTIQTNGEYVNLATEAGITFTEGTTYAIQIQNPAWLREGENGKGFLFDKDKGLSWTCKGEDLYIKTDYRDAIVNIAEDSGFFLNKSNGGSSTINLGLPQYGQLVEVPTTAGSSFLENGVLVQTNNVQYFSSGVYYNLNETIGADDKIELYLKYIHQDNVSSGTQHDSTLFSFGFANGDNVRIDMYAGFRLVYAYNGVTNTAMGSNVYPTFGMLTYCKFTLTQTTWKFETSTDGENWTSRGSGTFAGSATFENLTSLSVGKCILGGVYPLRAVTFLTDCYLHKNDTDIKLTANNAKDRNYHNYGCVLINDNFEATGFTSHASNVYARKYLQLKSFPNFKGASTWEMVFKLKLSTISIDNTIFSASASNQVVAFGINSSNKVNFNVGNSTGTGWASGDTAGTTSLSANTDYYVKLEFTGTKYVASLSNDGTTWTEEASYTSSDKVNSDSSYTAVIGIARALTSGALQGTLYLNDSYIKLDDTKITIV